MEARREVVSASAVKLPPARDGGAAMRARAAVGAGLMLWASSGRDGGFLLLHQGGGGFLEVF